VQGESGFARREFTPAGRFEPKLETECVTVERSALFMSVTNLITYRNCVPSILTPSTEPLSANYPGLRLEHAYILTVATRR
jgi:hypothetical protein